MTGHQRRILMLALHCELTGDVEGAGYWYWTMHERVMKAVQTGD